MKSFRTAFQGNFERLTPSVMVGNPGTTTEFSLNEKKTVIFFSDTIYQNSKHFIFYYARCLCEQVVGVTYSVGS